MTKTKILIRALQILVLGALAFSPAITFAQQVNSTGSPVNFGNIQINNTQNQSVTFTDQDQSTSAISIEQVSASSDTNSEFNVTDQTCNGKTLTLGQSCTFQVSFTPDSAQTFQGQAIVQYSTAGVNEINNVGFALSGTGINSANTPVPTPTPTPNPVSPGSTTSGGCGTGGVVNISAVSTLFKAQYCTASSAILAAINTIMTVLGIIAALFIVWGGFQYVTSAGNSEKAESAQKTITNAAIGLVVAILAYSIVAVISNTLINH